MNRIWLVVIIASLGVLIYKSPDSVLEAMSVGSNKAVTLTLELLAVYALWNGILKILEETGISKLISKLLSPIVNFLFGKNLSQEAKKYVSMNMTANMLGMGGAATPMGIKAIEQMDDKQKTATAPMIMLVILSATSLQLIPTSVISLLAKNGSSNPTSIILPSLLSSAASTIIGVILVKFCSKIKFKTVSKPAFCFKKLLRGKK